MTPVKPEYVNDPDDLGNWDPKFDLDLDDDDGTAAEAEAKEKKIHVRIGGRVIEFPPLAGWDWEAHEMIGDGLIIEAFERVLESPEDAEHLRKQPGQKVVNLLEHLDRVSGVKTRDLRSSNRASRRAQRR